MDFDYSLRLLLALLELLLDNLLQPFVFINHFAVQEQRFGEFRALLHVLPGLELFCLPVGIQEAKHGGFQSEAVHDSKLLVEDNPGAPGFVLAHIKAAAVEAEEIALVGEELGQDATPEVPVGLQGILRTIHEHILLPGVTVDVRVAHDRLSILLLPNDRADESPQRSRFRVQLGIRIQKLAIQIVATNRGPIVSSDHSVRINHRHDLEDEPAAQIFSFWLVRTQEVQNSLHDV